MEKKVHYLAKRTHCKNGHEFTEENTYVNTRGFRTCKACRVIRLHKYRDNLSPERAKEIIETVKTWQTNNKDKVLEIAKLSKLRRYGLTPESYDEMYKEQKGCCKICKRHQSELKQTLFVDHCHTTSKTRGLLCTNCNSILGHCRDIPEILEEAIKYLKSYSEEEVKVTKINLN